MAEIQLGALVDLLGGRLEGNPEITVSGIAPLDMATSSQLTFLSNPKLRVLAAQSQAAALIISPLESESLGAAYRGARIITPNPYAYFARAAQWFVQQDAIPAPIGIHASAVIDPTAKIAESASIGPNVVVEEGAEICAGVTVEAGCFIGRGARIGENTCLAPRVTFHNDCVIGRNGVIRSGAVIGAEGFGFANDKGAWIKIPQVGRVVMGDDVQVGANTTIDRGTLSDTVIGNGVKLDNQIQIAHNCRIGDHTAMAACVGVAGSVTIGKHCTFAGAAMVSGHLDIADNVHISGGTVVANSISKPGQYTGVYPIAAHADWEKSGALVRNIRKLREKIRELERKLKVLT